jgi:hypothetical protein
MQSSMAWQLKLFMNRSFSLDSCHNRNGASGNAREKEMRMIGFNSVQFCAAWTNMTRKRKLRTQEF